MASNTCADMRLRIFVNQFSLSAWPNCGYLAIERTPSKDSARTCKASPKHKRYRGRGRGRRVVRRCRVSYITGSSNWYYSWARQHNQSNLYLSEQIQQTTNWWHVSYFFTENRLWHFVQNVSLFHARRNLFSRKDKKKKQLQNVVCWIFYPTY